MGHSCLRQGGILGPALWAPKVGQHWVLCLTALLLPPSLLPRTIRPPQVVKLWAFCERSQHEDFKVWKETLPFPPVPLLPPHSSHNADTRVWVSPHRADTNWVSHN